MSDLPKVSNQNEILISGFKITQALLLTHNGIKIDLMPFYLSINFIESIFSPTIYGDMSITEQFNFPTYGPIIGGENLFFKIKNYISSDSDEKEMETIELNCAVYNLQNKKIVKNRSTFWLLKFCSKEAIWNQQIRISTTIFEKPYSWIANDIFRIFHKEIRKLDALDNNDGPPDYINKTSTTAKHLYTRVSGQDEKVTCHFPNLHPFECMQFLAGRSNDTTKGNPYFFFENISSQSNKFFFISWKELNEKFNNTKAAIASNLTIDLNSSKSNKIIVVNNNQILKKDSEKEGTSEYFHPKVDFFAVTEFSQDKDFDFLENIRKGAYASSLITFDFLKKTIKKNNYSWDDQYTKIKRIYDSKENALIQFPENSDHKSKYFSFKYPETYIKTVPTNSKTFTDNRQDFTPEVTKNYRLLKMQEFNNNIMTVNITGNISFNCGKFVDVYLNSPDTTTTTQVKADPHFAGTYFILKVLHTFTLDQHFTTTMEISKDSFMDKTLLKFPEAKE